MRELELATFAAWLERRQASKDYRATYWHTSDYDPAMESALWDYMTAAWYAWCAACDELEEKWTSRSNTAST